MIDELEGNMKAEDTVKTGGELCIFVCQEYRSETLEAKNCDGLDCEVCQLTKQAEITWKARDPEIEAAEKAGMMKVVEWIEKQGYYSNLCPCECLTNNKGWQAQLKDWGILPNVVGAGLDG